MSSGTRPDDDKGLAGSDADTPYERRKAQPQAGDMTDAGAVASDGEVQPGRDGRARETGPAKRVADAGDLGQGATSPDSIEKQADAVARQTMRKD